MTRTIRYKQIASDLRRRVEELGVGNLLSSESDLSAEFGASRVTVRRALEQLRQEGLVESRQGFGWFVSGEPLRQRLTELVTIEGQLEERGFEPTRQILEFAFEAAPPRVRKALMCEQVLRVKRLNLADGHPFAVVTVWCPSELGQLLSRREVERKPFYELLDVELRGATQTIGADVASAEIAGLLKVPAGSPVLRCERVTTDVDGNPVLMSEHLFAAHRTEFVVELPLSVPSTTPSGLRLVD
ncbi:MAG: GntR family transcriptional regulator [Ilumatobacteraceae bacterium]